MPIDTQALLQNLADGAAWGTGFAIPFFLGITWAILKILSHPTIRKIASAADFIGKNRGGGLIELGKEIVQWLRGK